MNRLASNVTSAWTWINFNHVMQTEDALGIIYIYLLVNVYKCVLYIASWNFERLIAQ